MKFRKGQKAEFFIGGRWLPVVVKFVWRGVDLETKKRVFHYDVAGRNELGFPVDMNRVSADLLRRPNAARGRRRVLRAHSVKLEKFT